MGLEVNVDYDVRLASLGGKYGILEITVFANDKDGGLLVATSAYLVSSYQPYNRVLRICLKDCLARAVENSESLDLKDFVKEKEQ